MKHLMLTPMLPFPDFPEVALDENTQHGNIEDRKAKMLNQFMLKEVKSVGYYNMPLVAPFTKEAPKVFITSHEARSYKRHNVGVLFYEDDYQFDRVWNDPTNQLEFLRQFQCVVGPDYSQFLNMPYPARIWNNFRNKLLMAWMQSKGLDVIPNVTWSDADSYDYCFDGLPESSVIAISSLGMQSNSDSIFFWHKGYEEAVRRLKPTRIIRYGYKMYGEKEDISTYITNRHNHRN